MGDIPTLYDALTATPELADSFVQKFPIPGNTEKIKYKCQCGCFCFPFQFHDVRTIPGIDNDFICCGCYSKLERNLEDVDGLGKPATKREFKQRYLTLHNAPQALIDNVGKRYDAQGEYQRVTINKVTIPWRSATITHAELVIQTKLPDTTIFEVELPNGTKTTVNQGQSASVADGAKARSSG